jgi:hypothetical protein
MRKRDQYRQHAIACLRLADVATTPETRKVLLCMAQRWYKLAYSESAEDFPAGYPAERLTGTGD